MIVSYRNGIKISIYILFCLLLPLAVQAEDGKSQITVNPPSLKFYAAIGSPKSTPQIVSILSQNNQSLSFKSSDKWILFKTIETLQSARVRKLEVSVDAKDLDIGVYEGDILITDSKKNISKRVSVTLIIASNYYVRNCHD